MHACMHIYKDTNGNHWVTRTSSGSIVAPIRLNETPHLLNETPHLLNETPHLLYETPHLLYETPHSLTSEQAPGCVARVPSKPHGETN